MKTDVQKPDEWSIPDGVGLVLSIQTTPATYTVEELIAAANSRYDSEYRRRARYALGMPIPEQTTEELARRQQSVAMRQKALDQKARKMEKQRERRAKDRPKRSYRKRRR